MAEAVEVQFAPLSQAPSGTLILLAGEELALGATARALNERAKGALERAAAAADFSGKSKTAIELLAPAGLEAQRLVMVGSGRPGKELDRLLLGGYAFAQTSARKGESGNAHLRPRRSGRGGRRGALPPTWRSARCCAATLSRNTGRAASRRRAAEADAARRPAASSRSSAPSPEAAAKAFAPRKALADGVFLARDLVNEPANMLGPVEFAERMRDLEGSGLEIEVLDEDRAQGPQDGGAARRSVRAASVPRASSSCNGTAPSPSAPRRSCFVGKGVCFDTGGISMKPAGGMEDMKGDMGGAACVAGLMLALAKRNAAVNAVGLIGLTENMPSGNAQRPGDIITSMSGQTIEVLNTDAEGRLVLADVLWYAQERFKPRFVVDLATLTGAIMVALGKEYAGLFSNDDRLASELPPPARPPARRSGACRSPKPTTS